jgi:aminoglycoside/choline kinase family phosphotransferase
MVLVRSAAIIGSPSFTPLPIVSVPIDPATDTRLALVRDWLAQQPQALRLAPETLASASADASFRRYFRVQGGTATYIVMDAPPTHEDVRPFLKVAGLLHEAGLHAPRALAADEERGLLLLTDLGRETYLERMAGAPDAVRDDALMRAAIAALVRWQSASRPGVLPPYDAALLRRELELFPQWYLARHLGMAFEGRVQALLEPLFARIVAANLAQPAVFVHRDYMPRNLMVCEPAPGILDFQDAVHGPISYDIASLMRDAFHSWPEEQVLDWTVRYWQEARAAGLPVPDDFGAFWRDFEWMGLQRHLKVLGIFARINYRDGKPRYLADTPRFLGYVRRVAERYDELRGLALLLDEIEGRSLAVGYTF